jgi:hypothetical protein
MLRENKFPLFACGVRALRVSPVKQLPSSVPIIAFGH